MKTLDQQEVAEAGIVSLSNIINSGHIIGSFRFKAVQMLQKKASKLLADQSLFKKSPRNIPKTCTLKA